MARGRKPKSQGLGDTIEKITTATGIKKAVELFSSVTGIDCGCDERKEKLNALFPYSKIECLNESEYNYLTSFFEQNLQSIKPSIQVELLRIYNRVFNVNQEPTTCSDCWRDIISKLKKLHNEYITQN